SRLSRMRHRRALGVATGATGLALVAFLACDPVQPPTTTSRPVAPMPSEFGLDVRPANPTCLAPARPPLPLAVKLERVFANVKLENAVVLTQIPGDPGRWFVAERMGPDGSAAPIVSFDANDPDDTPRVVATLGPLAYVTEGDGEGGLIGMAFHP